MRNVYVLNEAMGLAAIYGVGTYTQELAKCMQGQDVNITIVNLFAEGKEYSIGAISDIPVWNIPGNNTTGNSQANMNKYYRTIVKLLRLRIDKYKNIIFHLNYTKSLSLIEELKKAFECKIVTVIHSLPTSLIVKGNILYLRNIILKNEEFLTETEEFIKNQFQEEKSIFEISDQIISLSRHTHTFLQTDYGILPQKIKYIPNGMMDSLNNESKTRLRKKFNIGRTEKILLFAGRLNDDKGLDALIEAFRNVQRRGMRCKLIIVGDGDFHKYIQMTHDVWNNVIFTGRLHRSKLFELYRVADIGILPSLYEQCSYVAIEMMMFGLPILGAKAPGLEEVIEENITGLTAGIIPQEDTVKIVRKELEYNLMKLLKNPQLVMRMRLNSRKKYIKSYESSIMRDSLLEVYKNL